jgi:urea transport system ATP-binding protein
MFVEQMVSDDRISKWRGGMMTQLTVSEIDLYYGAAQALRKVSIEARPQKITAVLGRNGVGKSSLLRAITGTHPVSRGEIRLDADVLGSSPPYARARKGIGYVPQGREIFPLITVKENLQTGFACLTPDERTIPDTVFTLFPVLKEMLGRRGGDLSGGQQQQLAIGRAMVTRPKVLVLDEPTEGIQPSIIKDIGRALQFLRDDMGMTILLVEQYLDFCRELADDIYVMDRGEILHSGSASDLDKPGVRRHLMV